MRFADRPHPTHQHQAGAEPVEEGLSGFWQMSTAFNGSQHANPRSSATRFIGKRANSPSGGKRPSTHAQIQYARMRIGCRTRIAGAITAEAPTRRRPKTKIQFNLQENCDCGSLDKLHLAQIGDFSLQTGRFARKTQNLRVPIVRNRNFLANSYEKLLRRRGGR